MTRWRWPIAVLTALGLGVALWAIGRAGAAELVHAAQRLGIGGFALLCLYTLAVLTALGAACQVAAVGEPIGRLPVFVWSRWVREAASELLPFAQAGGLALGARVLIRAGIAPPRVYAAMIVDLTTEMASQLVFTLAALWGLASLLVGHGGATGVALVPLAWVGLGVTAAIAGAFLLFQKPALRIAGALADKVLPGSDAAFDRVRATLEDFYRARGAVAASFLLNLLAWCLTAGFAWLALGLIGSPRPLADVAALESLILTLRSAAFVVPGALGVQEAGYVLLAPAFAIDPRAAVALSLVKRARDVAVGLPALLAFQTGEFRARPSAPPV